MGDKTLRGRPACLFADFVYIVIHYSSSGLVPADGIGGRALTHAGHQREGPRSSGAGQGGGKDRPPPSSRAKRRNTVDTRP